MSVYDRWHLSHPDPAAHQPCKCGRGRNKLYPAADHGAARRWQVRYRDDTGRQRKRNFTERYGDDPGRHAEAFDAKVNSELDSHTYIAPERGKITLGEFTAQWRAGLTSDPASLENIDRRLAHILGPADDPTIISKTGMASLAGKPSLIRQWLKGLRNKSQHGKALAPGYVKDIADTLSSIFVAAIEDGVARTNPVRAKSVRLPPRAKKVIEPWTSAMVAAARAELQAWRECGAMADLGAGAGLRQGEIFAIAEDDIVFLGRKPDRKIKVRRQVKLITGEDGKAVPVFAPPKGGKERDVPLSDTLGRRLAAHIKACPPMEVTLPWKEPDGKLVTVRLLFVRAPGVPWERRSFNWLWRKARAAAGAAPTRENGMHVLRHTYASLTLHRGVDVIKVAAWLGHTDAGFTLRVYGHFIPDLADLGREAVDDFLEPKPDAGESETEQGGS